METRQSGGTSNKNGSLRVNYKQLMNLSLRRTKTWNINHAEKAEVAEPVEAIDIKIKIVKKLQFLKEGLNEELEERTEVLTEEPREETEVTEAKEVSQEVEAEVVETKDLRQLIKLKEIQCLRLTRPTK
jgi:hypothetical protein